MRPECHLSRHRRTKKISTHRDLRSPSRSNPLHCLLRILRTSPSSAVLVVVASLRAWQASSPLRYTSNNHDQRQRYKGRMSNNQVGTVYQQIIQDVVESSRVDFEEGGVDEHVLEELKQVSPHLSILSVGAIDASSVSLSIKPPSILLSLLFILMAPRVSRSAGGDIKRCVAACAVLLTSFAASAAGVRPRVFAGGRASVFADHFIPEASPAQGLPSR